MTAAHCANAEVYISACKREHAQCSDALVYALDTNAKTAALGQGEVPLNDVDMCCVAEVVRTLTEDCALRVLVLEENSFGLQGITALMEAIEANPNRIRELRLGKNNLKDQAAVIIGHTLSRSGCGLKVLDLSENGITKLGVIPITAALQQPFSDIVELSFHNNKIEGDAASYLGQAVRAAPKLKHLHLGYNALRDTGATQIARSIPHASCLSTMDLTANRISREGGQELVRALLSPSCTVQRLNLRHNHLDSETIEQFADVIAHNTSLIQLFLGFMNPSNEAAAAVLTAVPQNHTLLLLDVYGWKLNPKSTLPLIRTIQEKNSSIAAIVTDACQAIAAQVDEGNVVREEQLDLHPVYVGPDDRDAYLATKSLRRYSRAQSRRQSRARGTSQPGSRTASSRRRSEREGSHPASRSSRAGSHRSAHRRHHHHHRNGSEADGNGQLSAPPSARSASRSARSSRDPAEAGQLVPASAKKVQPSIDMLVGELGETSCDPQTVSVLKKIISQLQTTCRQQGMQIQSLTGRVRELEKRRECQCVSTAAPGAADAAHATSSNGFGRSQLNGSGTVVTPSQRAASHTSQGRGLGQSASRISDNSVTEGAASRDAGNPSLLRQQSQQNAFQRSMSRVSQNTAGTVMERCTTPYVSRDVPPEIAHPNDVSGDHHPEGVGLQRSASIPSFPPRIEPSPAQDSMPPRRKSISHVL